MKTAKNIICHMWQEREVKYFDREERRIQKGKMR